MTIEVRSEIANGASFSLAQALLIYSDGAAALASLHDVRDHEGAPEIAAGRLLDGNQIDALVRTLLDGAGGGCAYQPERVLGHGVSQTVWWRPAGQRPMHLAGAAASRLPGLSGRAAPHPPLVFAARQRELLVYALQQDARPTPATPLMHAPYPNLYAGGRVCLGSARVPERHGPDRLDAWEACWDDSAFSHANPGGGAPNVRHAGGLMGLWQSALRAPERGFPATALVDAGITLGDLLAMRAARGAR